MVLSPSFHPSFSLTPSLPPRPSVPPCPCPSLPRPSLPVLLSLPSPIPLSLPPPVPPSPRPSLPPSLPPPVPPSPRPSLPLSFPPPDLLSLPLSMPPSLYPHPSVPPFSPSSLSSLFRQRCAPSTLPTMMPSPHLPRIETFSSVRVGSPSNSGTSRNTVSNRYAVRNHCALLGGHLENGSGFTYGSYST